MIFIGSDHTGVSIKEKIKKLLSESNFEISDIGTESDEQKVDYPDIAQNLVAQMRDPSDKGILICGTGVGMSIAANRFSNIRAALAWNEEIAEKARSHNDANVLCLSARNVSDESNLNIVKSWLNTTFSNEERHVNRIKKLK